MLLNEGEVIRESYKIDRLIGEGAFAEVYRVEHRVWGTLAMKVFKSLGTMEETLTALEEAMLLSRMGHRNVIGVKDADVIETANGIRGFFAMEYMPEGSLHDFWYQHDKKFVPYETSVEIINQVCHGLSVAHNDKPRPIVHRDIKPQNILVGNDERGLRVCLTDFGLAKRVNPMMLQLSAKGTVCFKAPETFLDPMSDSCAGDVWATGVTLYLLLTDRFPFDPPNGDCKNLDYRCFEKPLKPPSEWNIRVDDTLDEIVKRALAIKKEERHQNASELLKDLARWQPRPLSETDRHKDFLSTPSSKDVLGTPAKVDEAEVREMISRAFRISRETGRLTEAADLMEQAINRWPVIREEYEPQIKRWRANIIM